MKSLAYRFTFTTIAVLLGLVSVAVAFPGKILSQTQYNIADINKDGIVDLTDYSILAEDFFKTGQSLLSDFNLDEIVDLTDYSILAENFFKTGPDSSPTPTYPASPTPTPMTHVEGESMAMSTWKPLTQYDKCDDGTDVVTAHKFFHVIGPDGKQYPTWHAPVVTNPITGSGNCYFGHEHGRNPSAFQFFSDIQQHFAYDADHNGQISSAELAKSGVPFGYVNEQMDAYYASNPNGAITRHEDHVGHKVEFANGEGDIGEGTDPFDSNMTGGVVVPQKSTASGRKWDETGIRCYHFQKVHQGVNSPDAFSNNLHELLIYTNCVSTRASFPSSKALLTTMIPFGAPQEFTRFCGADRNQIISVPNANLTNFPGTRQDGFRNIVTRDCVESSMLVPAGQFSSFPYEIWSAGIRIRTANNTVLASNGGAWEVLDAIRYYNPTATNKISYLADVCYETQGDRKARGGTCDVMTNYGAITGITWNDPRSRFRGVQRGQYVNPHILNNAGGATVWYTDPFGGNATTTPFPGATKQMLSSVKTTTDFSIDPRIILRTHDTGSNTVHAPN